METRPNTSTLLSNGIAHVSFAGGGVFLPVRNSSDRQSLADTITSRAHLRGLVQVIMDDQRWLVQDMQDRHAADCSTCGAALDAACYAAADDRAVAYCVHCVFARGVIPPAPPFDTELAATVEISR